MLTREERGRMRVCADLLGHPADGVTKSLLDHADEADKVIAQLREALEEAKKLTERVIASYVPGESNYFKSMGHDIVKTLQAALDAAGNRKEGP